MTTSFKVRINLNRLRFLPLHSRGRSRIDSHSGYRYPVLVPKPCLFIKNFDWIKNPTRRKQAEEAHRLFVKNFNSIEKGHIWEHLTFTKISGSKLTIEIGRSKL